MSRLRIAVPILTAALALAAHGESLYIIPVMGSVEGTDAFFYGDVRIINPSAATAHLTVDAYLQNGGNCAIPPFEVASGERTTFPPRCAGVFAEVIHSDQPLYIRADILGLKKCYLEPLSCSSFFYEQRVVPMASWIAARQVAVVPDIELLAAESGTRANVYLVNPGSEPLDVQIHVERPEFRNSYDDAVTVAPKSLRVYSMREVEWSGPPPLCCVGINGFHDVTVSADGPFQVGASYVHPGGAGVWREAVPLQ